YKGHIAVDPTSEIITATSVTPGNVGDADAAKELLEEALVPSVANAPAIEVYGDASYGSAELVEHIEKAGAVANVKVQPPPAKAGMFSQAAFTIDCDAQTVRCPENEIPPIV